jgi:hypothetical protein
LKKLSLEKRISPLPPIVLGGVLVVPIGLLAEMTETKRQLFLSLRITQASAAKAQGNRYGDRVESRV